MTWKCVKQELNENKTQKKPQNKKQKNPNQNQTKPHKQTKSPYLLTNQKHPKIKDLY